MQKLRRAFVSSDSTMPVPVAQYAKWGRSVCWCDASHDQALIWALYCTHTSHTSRSNTPPALGESVHDNTLPRGCEQTSPFVGGGEKIPGLLSVNASVLNVVYYLGRRNLSFRPYLGSLFRERGTRLWLSRSASGSPWSLRGKFCKQELVCVAICEKKRVRRSEILTLRCCYCVSLLAPTYTESKWEQTCFQWLDEHLVKLPDSV